MKKISLTVFSIFLLVLLAACGQGEQKGQETETNESSNTQSVDNVLDHTTDDESEVDPNEATNKEATTMYPQLSNEVAANEALVVMNTTMGPIKIKLFKEQAPKTVENFLTHAENGYYNGIIFHRVIKDFMIQGGDPTGTGMGGESIYGDSFEDEFTMDLFNLRGALSMANAGPNTNGSQFFIVQASNPPAKAAQLTQGGWPEEIAKAYEENGGTPHLDQKHTVFGQVIEGMDIVDKIATAKTDRSDKPAEEISIESIDIIQK